MMKLLRELMMIMGCGMAACLSSCGTHYAEEQVSLARGQAHRGCKLTRVEAGGVHIERSSSDGRLSNFYPVAGRPHMDGSHSLGNNESLKILELDPRGQTAKLEFRWLDRVGPLTMPPF